MRLTVGPLPAGVYWRRRAVVLGVILIVVLLLAYSCGGGEEPGAQQPGPVSAEQDLPAEDASSAVPTPRTDTPAATGPDQKSPAGAASSSPAPAAATPQPAGICTDQEMRITASAFVNKLARGVKVEVTLKIKNASKRTCSRDVGADVQELRIVRGATKIWSSDDCGGATGGTDVRSFAPNQERTYTVAWDGYATSTCGEDRPLPPAGDYQLIGRLGTKLSDPVKMTLT